MNPVLLYYALSSRYPSLVLVLENFPTVEWIYIYYLLFIRLNLKPTQTSAAGNSLYIHDNMLEWKNHRSRDYFIYLIKMLWGLEVFVSRAYLYRSYMLNLSFGSFKKENICSIVASETSSALNRYSSWRVGFSWSDSSEDYNSL